MFFDPKKPEGLNSINNALIEHFWKKKNILLFNTQINSKLSPFWFLGIEQICKASVAVSYMITY